MSELEPHSCVRQGRCCYIGYLAEDGCCVVHHYRVDLSKKARGARKGLERREQSQPVEVEVVLAGTVKEFSIFALLVNGVRGSREIF